MKGITLLFALLLSGGSLQAQQSYEYYANRFTGFFHRNNISELLASQEFQIGFAAVVIISALIWIFYFFVSFQIAVEDAPGNALPRNPDPSMGMFSHISDQIAYYGGFSPRFVLVGKDAEEPSPEREEDEPSRGE
jgi:hypothetical protein